MVPLHLLTGYNCGISGDCSQLLRFQNIKGDTPRAGILRATPPLACHEKTQPGHFFSSSADLAWGVLTGQVIAQPWQFLRHRFAWETSTRQRQIVKPGYRRNLGYSFGFLNHRFECLRFGWKNASGVWFLPLVLSGRAAPLPSTSRVFGRSQRCRLVRWRSAP